MQGLQASISVLDAELVSIDRDQQCITLSNMSKVQYGVLVLTMGLQSPKHQPGLGSRQVLTLQGLQSSVPEVTAYWHTA